MEQFQDGRRVVPGKTKMVLGPDDFPWDYPAAILELFHGRTERWAKGRDVQHGYQLLIYSLIDSSTGVTADRREELLYDPAVRYVSRSNSATLLASGSTEIAVFCFCRVRMTPRAVED